MQVLKRCTTCQQDQPLENFRKQSKNKDGLKYTCRSCDDARAKIRYYAKKELIIDQVRHWQRDNRDKTRVYQDRWRQKNVENPQSNV